MLSAADVFCSGVVEFAERRGARESQTEATSACVPLEEEHGMTRATRCVNTLFTHSSSCTSYLNRIRRTSCGYVVAALSRSQRPTFRLPFFVIYLKYAEGEEFLHLLKVGCGGVLLL